MDGSQRIIFVLLVLAIVFSALSIFISYSTFFGVDLPTPKVSGKVVFENNGGNIGIVVEGEQLPTGG